MIQPDRISIVAEAASSYASSNALLVWDDSCCTKISIHDILLRHAEWSFDLNHLKHEGSRVLLHKKEWWIMHVNKIPMQRKVANIFFHLLEVSSFYKGLKVIKGTYFTDRAKDIWNMNIDCCMINFWLIENII